MPPSLCETYARATAAHATVAAAYAPPADDAVSSYLVRGDRRTRPVQRGSR